MGGRAPFVSGPLGELQHLISIDSDLNDVVDEGQCGHEGEGSREEIHVAKLNDHLLRRHTWVSPPAGLLPIGES